MTCNWRQGDDLDAPMEEVEDELKGRNERCQKETVKAVTVARQ